MSGDKGGNLVNNVMQELVQENGSYDEERGEFSKISMRQPSRKPTAASLNNLKEQFYQHVYSNPKLRALVNNNEGAKKSINDMTENEDLLKELMDDPSMIEPMLLHILDGSKAQSNSNIVEESKIERISRNESIPDIKINSQLQYPSQQQVQQQVQQQDSFSITEFLSGPVIAMICYFLVTNTPLIYYLGQVPYIGEMLISNKFFISILLIGVLFILITVVLDFSGLL